MVARLARSVFHAAQSVLSRENSLGRHMFDCGWRIHAIYASQFAGEYLVASPALLFRLSHPLNIDTAWGMPIWLGLPLGHGTTLKSAFGNRLEEHTSELQSLMSS